MIGLRRSGSVCLLFFICANFLFFALQALLPLCRCPFFLYDFIGSHTSLSFFSLPSFRRAGWRWTVSRCPCVASRGFSSPPAQLGPAGRDLGVALSATCFVQVSSPSSSLHARLGDGAGESSGVFSVLGCLSCLISARSARRVRLPSAAPVRVLIGLPIFGLGGREGALSPLLDEWLSCAVLLLMLSLYLPCSVRRARRCGRGLSRWLFSLVRSRCDRWRSTDR